MIIISDEIIEEVEMEFKKILNNNSVKNIKSFKWSKLNKINKVNAFKDFFNYISPFLLNNQIYIHVLIWNVNDSRHLVYPRDDNKNLQIMYYKIIRNFANYYLNDEDSLVIYPDRQNILNWQLIEEILEKEGFFTLKYGRTIHIEESNTNDAFLIQLADIFAGIGRTSYVDYEDYELRGDENQKTLIQFENDISVLKKSRFKIIRFINNWAKKHKLQISIKKTKGFKSHKKGPLNFWLYEPQHDGDKAPIKEKNL